MAGQEVDAKINTALSRW